MLLNYRMEHVVRVAQAANDLGKLTFCCLGLDFCDSRIEVTINEFLVLHATSTKRDRLVRKGSQFYGERKPTTPPPQVTVHR